MECPLKKRLKEMLEKYFNPAVNMAPNLQLPLILRSKVLAEMGFYIQARQDSQKAHSLNSSNKRGIVSEKLVGWMEQINMKQQCRVFDFKQQIQLACSAISNSCCLNTSVASLSNSLSNTVNQIHLLDFNCLICLDTMVDPITIPCGHSVCRSCLIDAMDHSNVCAMCRTSLPPLGHVVNRSMDSTLANLFSNLFNKPISNTSLDVTMDCRESKTNELPQQWIPLFECPIIYPTSSANFHVSECRHRVIFLSNNRL